MAKKTKRRVIVPTWIVRDTNGEYRAFVSRVKPKFVVCKCGCKQKVWRLGRDTWGLSLCEKDYEAGTETSDHLKPGGIRKMKLARA